MTPGTAQPVRALCGVRGRRRSASCPRSGASCRRRRARPSGCPRSWPSSPRSSAPAHPVPLPQRRARRGRVRQRALRLSGAAGRRRARRRVVPRQARREGRDRRPVGRRQEHDLPPDPALLRSEVRHGDVRRRATVRRRSARSCAATSRWCRRTPRSSRMSVRDNIRFGRPDATDAEIERAAEDARRRRVHPRAAAGLRHAGRRARRHAVRRPAPAHRDRARDPARRAAPAARRGDLLARRRKRDAGADGARRG